MFFVLAAMCVSVAAQKARLFVPSTSRWVDLRSPAFAGVPLAPREGRASVQLRSDPDGLARSDKPALPDERAVVKLTFFAGVADVLTFPRFRVYVTRLSGTLYSSVTAVVDQRWTEAWFLASLVLSNAVGAALFQLVRKKWVPHLMFALFALADLLWRVALPARIAAVPIAVAFGVVNTLSVDLLKTNTFAYPGHMQTIGFCSGSRGSVAVMILMHFSKGQVAPGPGE